MKKQYKQQLTPRSVVEPKQKDKVKVILRIRPFQRAQENEEFLVVQDENTVLVNKPGYPSLMKFNYVQSQNLSTKITKQTSQQNIFDSVKQAVQCIFQGVDSTIFAYGQTGAGKTYTIVGNCPELNSDTENYKVSLLTNERGILPRALQRVFDQQAVKRDSRITISFFQIYNEKIFDLLDSTSMKPLQIRETKLGELSIPGLSFVQVVSMKEVINYLAEGIKNRATSSTQANIKSSRSHSIFHVKYEKLVINQEGDHEVIVANLRIVDLAGSEKFNVPHDAPQAEKEIKFLELKSINGSLSKLGHCISALTSQSRSHIPFRDSKLTRILSDSLLGSGKIRLIICVSPSTTAMHQTSSTLQFADRVKKAVFQRPTLSIQKKKTVDFQEFKQLQKQLQLQKTKRTELQNMLKEFLKTRNLQEQDLLKENYKLKQEVALLKEEIKIYSGSNRLAQQSNQLVTSVRDIGSKPLHSVSNNNNISTMRKSKSPINNNNKTTLITNKQPTLSPRGIKSSQLKINQNQISITRINKSPTIKRQNKPKLHQNSTENNRRQIRT